MSEKKNYALRRAALGRWPVLSLSEEDAGKLLRATDIVREAIDGEEKLDILLANHVTFEKELLQLSVRDSFGQFNLRTLQSDRSLVSRHFMNVLTSCTLYRDSTVGNLRRIIGASSPELHNFTNTVGKGNSNQPWAWRLAEALRNHAQHAALPISSVKHHAKWLTREIADDDPVFERRRYGISLSVDVDELSENRGFDKGVLEELKNLKRPPDLKLILREYVDVFRSAHKIFRKAINAELAEYEKLVCEFLAKYLALDQVGNETAIALVEMSDDGKFKKIEFIRSAQFDYRTFLVDKNVLAGELAKAYVTSEIIFD